MHGDGALPPPTAAARWHAEQIEAAERARLPGPLPTSLALLPLLLASLLLRPAAAPSEDRPQEESPLLLDVLVTDTGYRLRVTDVTAEGWPPPQRSWEAAQLLEERRSYVYRIAGHDPSRALLAAARDLLGPEGRVPPRLWLRAEDAVPWEAVLEAGQALRPLHGAEQDPSPLASVALDVRP